MDIEGTAIRVVGSVLGSSLYLFLTVLLATKRRATPADRIALGAVFCAAVWNTSNAIYLYQTSAFLEPDPALERSLAVAAWWSRVAAPAFLLHLAAAWAGVSALWGLSVYAAPLYILLAEAQDSETLAAYTGVFLAAAIGISIWLGWRRQAERRAFHLCMAGTLCATGLAALAGEDSRWFVWALLLPAVCLIHYIRRYNILGILIGRRVVFVFTLSTVSAIYLFLIWVISENLALAFATIGGLIELSLVWAAVLLWLPMFEWITRFFSKRTELYLKFAKRIIEEADRILDLPARIQFLAEEVGRLFELRRILLATTSSPRHVGFYGYGENPGIPPEIETLEERFRVSKVELLHVRRAADDDLQRLLEKLGFSYAFALWYRESLIGLLLADTAPRLYLDESEAILQNLCREISHSIESCRLVEDKIRLERELLRQEHLASLGKVAATIAHEVKNPLSSIKTLAQLMGEDPAVDEKYHRDVGFIVSETDRLASCVEQLLTFSRPAAEPKPEVAVLDLLETTARALEREYAGQRIRIQRMLDERLRDHFVDRQNLQQIVLNLALNAVQAAGPGATVAVTAAVQPDGRIRIEVTDDGPGIPAGIRDHIFEPFFTTRKQGTGLGLAIVKKNIQQLGGSVSVESPAANGRGSKFEVVLPAAVRTAVQV